MSGETLGFGDYLKEAFHRRVKVPLLGTLPANTMALGIFAVLGLANPGFWLLGAAGEVAYLFATASSQRFQNVVQGERLLTAQEGWEEKLQAKLEKLRDDSRQRYFSLLGQCRRILGMAESSQASSLAGVHDLRSHSLDQMLTIFLRLLGSREAILDNLRNVDRETLEGKIARLKERLADLDPEAQAALARSLRGTLDIQRKRLQNLGRAVSSLNVIDAELQRIEEQVVLLREESAVSGGPGHLSTRLDSVTSAMQETSRWMDDHSDLLGGMGDEELASPARHLPRLPNTLEGE
jgi:hypothetical protein